jgi:hypothetical protein
VKKGCLERVGITFWDGSFLEDGRKSMPVLRQSLNLMKQATISQNRKIAVGGIAPVPLFSLFLLLMARLLDDR